MIKGLRIHLGMTQKDMASYLGISRSLLSMAELGRRTLEADASQRLERLRATIAGKAAQGPVISPSIRSIYCSETLFHLEKQMNRCRYLIIRIKQTIEKIESMLNCKTVMRLTMLGSGRNLDDQEWASYMGQLSDRELGRYYYQKIQLEMRLRCLEYQKEQISVLLSIVKEGL